MNNIYFIAEVGINHEGDFKSAKEYCYKAKQVGANAVKFQWVKADNAYKKDSESYEIFKNSYLSFDEMNQLNDICKSLDIDFFATPGDMDSLYQLSKITLAKFQRFKFQIH